VAADGQADDFAAVRENGSRDPSTVRPRLAEAAAEGLEGIRKTLLDAATGAVRDHWITFRVRRVRIAQTSRGSRPGRSRSGGRDRALAA
jgi:hypothetical protein